RGGRASRRPGFPAGPAGRRHRARARRLDPARGAHRAPRAGARDPALRHHAGGAGGPHGGGAVILTLAVPPFASGPGGVIQSIDFAAIAVPLILACAAGLVLLLDAFLPDRPGSGRAVGLVALGGVLAALAATAVQGAQGVERRTFCVPASLAADGAPPPCSFVADRFTLVFAAVVLAAGVVVVLLSMAELATGRVPVGEWYFLLLATLTGAVLLPASRDLITLVVALEVVSLPVFALTALRRYDGRATEAALKLFLFSVVATAVTLFGASLLYGVTGSVFLDRIALAQAGPGSPVTTVAIMLMLAGFAFKAAAVPFHSWAGDVYRGAPIPVAALLSVVSKAAGFAGLILLLTTALGGRAATWA